jgi:UDP-GlcNAc:undecaprenyl-phosphate/decaprenyl-phosphate GlcNAc-1-phosphate transferase
MIIYAILAFFMSAIIAAMSMPRVIRLSVKKRLMDNPDNGRKQHKNPTPTLGGVGIFFGFILSASVLGGFIPAEGYPFLVAAMVLLFIVGVKDDLMVVAARKKLIAQIVASSLIVFGTSTYVPDLGGLFGINGLPVLPAQLFSVFAMVIILNSYNLIDGIDGLAGTIGFIASSTFGTLLYLNGYLAESIMAFALAGALVGFLIYNFDPARIFMGDTGSMVVGILLAYLGFRTMQANPVAGPAYIPGVAVFVFAVLIIPMYDTARVIVLRLRNGQSPMAPDSNHIHHNLMRAGFSHRGIVAVMGMANLLILTTAFILRELPIWAILSGVIGMAMLILPSAKILIKVVRRTDAITVTTYHANGAHIGNESNGSASRAVHEREPAELFH